MISLPEQSREVRKGFTLLEVLFSLTLLMMMIPMGTYLGKSGEVMVNNISHHGSSRRFMERLGNDLRRTTDLSYTQLPGFNNDTTLVLTLVNSSGGSETVTYTFHHATDQVTRKVGVGSNEVVLSDIVALYYKFYDSSGVQTNTQDDIKMVETSMVFEKDVVDVKATQTMNSTRVVLRNGAVN